MSFLNITMDDITDSYILAFLSKVNIKGMYCISKSDEISNIKKSLSLYFLNFPMIDSEAKPTKKHNFDKNLRNILITDSHYWLEYLRQGFFNLSELNFLVFEPHKLPFNEEHPLETILKEFYIPQSKVEDKGLPPIFILHPSLIKVSDNFDVI